MFCSCTLTTFYFEIQPTILITLILGDASAGFIYFPLWYWINHIFILKVFT